MRALYFGALLGSIWAVGVMLWTVATALAHGGRTTIVIDSIGGAWEAWADLISLLALMAVLLIGAGHLVWLKLRTERRG